MTQAEIEQALRDSEGLVFETARQIQAGGVELEFEDICQLLRIKAWQAVAKFSDKRAAAAQGTMSDAVDRHGRTPLERFVFGCMTNLRYDIEKRRPRRYNASIDEIKETGVGVEDWFDVRYLSVDAEQVFAEVEDEVDLDDLDEQERAVVTLQLAGFSPSEIGTELGLPRAQREQVMRSVREKLSGLRPSGPSRPRAPRPPLPAVERRPAPIPVVLAA